jgi:hypothetical protein
MRSSTALHVHNTEPELYDSLVRLFGETRGETASWTKIITNDGVEVTFFKRRDEEVVESGGNDAA